MEAFILFWLLADALHAWSPIWGNWLTNLGHNFPLPIGTTVDCRQCVVCCMPWCRTNHDNETSYLVCAKCFSSNKKCRWHSLRIIQYAKALCTHLAHSFKLYGMCNLNGFCVHSHTTERPSHVPHDIHFAWGLHECFECDCTVAVAAAAGVVLCVVASLRCKCAQWRSRMLQHKMTTRRIMYIVPIYKHIFRIWY